MKKVIILLAILLLNTSKFSAQEVKFGKVSKKELEEKFYPQDTSANAVVLYKKQRVSYDYNQNSGWNLKTEIHERVKLYNKEGFDSATKKIHLYTSGGEDEKFSIKAYTYNLENGKIQKTKLEKNGIFKEKVSKYWNKKNFTMPNLKEGSIVEWKYVISSPFYWNIDDVICQYKIPIKYIDVKIQIPEYFEFKNLTSRYYPIRVKESRVQKNYSITTSERQGGTGFSATKTNTEHNTVSVIEYAYTTSLSNVPALVEEPYMTNILNYGAKIDFEITAYKPKYGIAKYYNNTWKDVTKTIYNSSRFGEQLNKKNHFKDDLSSVTNGLTTSQEKIHTIFEFVKNKMKWNEIYSKYVSIEGIRNAYKEGIGNVAEINLTLVAMLREAGLIANPILVSTRNNGIPIFPTSEGYNYVIAGVEIANKIILLDATEKYSAPNVLPFRALNWEGRLIQKGGASITTSLYPSVYNLKNVKLSVDLDEEGTITGMMNTKYSNLNALQYRDNYNASSDDDIISKLETKYNGIEIEKLRINNKENTSKSIVELIKFSQENQADVIDNKIYISPLLFLTINENPFKLEDRIYPIDYGSPWKNKTSISIQIPDGYRVDSKPDNISLSLPNDLGGYTFQTSDNGNTIQISSVSYINNATISSIHYKNLKELYKQAIENQLKKIVLVKKQP